METYRRLIAESIPKAVFATTTRPGEERDLAARAVDEGFEVVVAVGGDGTWSNVADRLVASGRTDVALGILPNGTGNDFGRNLGFDPANPSHAVKALAAGHVRSIDVGRVDSLSASEHSPALLEARHFLNLVGFGFDVAVIDAASRARFLKGALLYKVTALRQLFRFAGIDINIESGSGVVRSRRHLMLTVSNGQYFGGGFPIAPGATVEDGWLHACQISDAAPLTRLKLFNMAERGRHVTSDRVEVLSDASFRLEFDEPVRFEMDGDVRRAAQNTLDVRVMPLALRVVAPAPLAPVT